MGNVIPPQYGVPLTADELNSSIPTSIMYGVTPSNEFIPVQINAAGALAISGTISVGTVTIEAVDPVDTSTHPLAIVNFGSDGYALRTAIFDGGNQLAINTDGSLRSNIGGDDFSNTYRGYTSTYIGTGKYGLATSLYDTQGNILKINPDGSINVNTSLALTNVGLVNTSNFQINPATEDTLSNIKTQTDKFTFLTTRLLVDGSQVTQPISGSVNVSNFPVTQTVTGTVISTIEDTAGNPLTSTTGSLNVNITGGSSSGPTTIDNGSIVTGQTVGLNSALLYGFNGVTWERVDSSSNRLIIDGSQVTQPVSGTVTVDAGSGNFTVVQSTGSNLHVDVDNFPSIQTVAISQSGTDNNVDANITNSTLAVTQSGTWTVQQGTPPWSVSQSGVWLTGRTWVLSSGTDSVNIGNFPATQAVTQSTSPWIISGTVTANIGTTNGLALDTSINGILVSQGSTTLGEKGPLIQGAVTTSAPSYTTAQTSPLSLTTSGALRTDSSATIQPVSGTIAATQSGSWTVSLTSESIEIGTVDQGTPNTIANAWPVVPTDGVHSQSFTASGEAKVDVTQPLPSGTNVIGHVITDSGSTTTVTGNVTVIQGTGTNLHTVVDSGSITVTQVTAANLNATVIGTVTANIGTTGGLALDSSLTTIDTDIKASQPRKMQDGSGNALTSQVNGSQRALDIGINVAGVQIDPRSIRALTSSDVVTADQGGIWSVGRTWTLSSGTDSVAALQSGTWNINNISGTISLPTGASTSSNQTSGSQKTQIVDGSGNVIASTSNALNVDVTNFPSTFGVTQSTSPWVISGTVTANAGTNLNTSALALDTSVNGILVSQGSTTSGEKGPLIQGAVTTSAPAYTTAQTSPLSLTTSGALRTDSSATTQPVSGTVTANQGGAPWSVSGSGNFTVVQSTGTNLHTVLDSGTLTSITNALPSGTNVIGHVITDSGSTTTVTGTVAENLTQIGGNSVVTGGANGLLAVAGPVASGATNADNPLKVGAVFNTTQPTVTNGQIVDVQATSRGAQIVATGVDTFNVTVNTPLPAGTNTIGNVGVTQGSTTSGQSGELVQGAVTTSAPSYTTAQTNPLSLTVAGDLRTVAKLQDGSGTALTSTLVSTKQSLDVDISASADGAAALANQVFTTSFSFNLPTSGTESLAVYLKNPNASGKTLVIKRIHVAPITATNAMTQVRVYSNPTTSANGTSQTVTTTSIGSGATAVATAFSGPTASANGAQLLGFSVTSAADGSVNNHINIDGLIRIAANNTLLITGTPTSNNFNMVWTVIWQEV